MRSVQLLFGSIFYQFIIQGTCKRPFHIPHHIIGDAITAAFSYRYGKGWHTLILKESVLEAKLSALSHSDINIKDLLDKGIDILQQKASKAGLNISELIRQAAIYGKVIARQTEEERHFTRQLAGMANNFNQIAKVAHQEGMTSTHRDFELYLHLVNHLLSKLQHGE